MAIDATPTKVRRAVWVPASTCVAVLALVVGLLRADGANGIRAPVISSVRAPDDPTEARSASFMYTSSETVRFECALDGASYAPCGRGIFGSVAYAGPLRLGEHRFTVRAVAGTRTSRPAAYGWDVVPSGASSSDGDTAATGRPVEFTIAGSVDGLVPGVPRVVALVLENPNDESIAVTSVEVAIAAQSDPPGCPSADNVHLGQPTGIADATPVDVRAHGSIVLDRYPQAPRVTLLARPTDQDACRAVTFALKYTGEAHS